LQLAAKADAVVIAAGFDATSETEDWDRAFGLPPGQEELIQKIAAANKNTIVVMTSGGAVDTTKWLDGTAALLQAWYPGQEGGTALAEILFGEVNPSGHLPATFEQRWEDNPVHDSYYPEPGTNRVTYKEGVFVGYRGYEHTGTKPLFAFGYGLSYTSFKYGDLAVKRAAAGSDSLYEVSFNVTNTGGRAGATVPQLYVADVEASAPRPPKELKGFTKVSLQPGETRKVTLPLNARAFAFYDVKAGQWRAEAGAFQLLVGESSDQPALKVDVSLDKTILIKN
jgi:beta-glucosidase